MAFAGNSLLCRLALHHTAIDPATFTAVRLVSGAAGLCLIAHWRDGAVRRLGNWPSALALFVYAAAFSLAYTALAAGTGALLLFGAVQAAMIGWGLWCGERLQAWQWLGLGTAVGGLCLLLWPGATAPDLRGSLLMLLAGAAWAVYTVRGRGQGDALQVTAGNFALAIGPALLFSGVSASRFNWDLPGLACALASGALASGLGYAVWYTVLPSLKTTTAASLQLSVPVIAAMGGVLFLAEPLTERLLLGGLAVLGGIALVLLARRT